MVRNRGSEQTPGACPLCRPSASHRPPLARHLISSIALSVVETLQVVALLTFVTFLFGIVGLQLFKGATRQYCAPDALGASHGAFNVSAAPGFIGIQNFENTDSPL